MDYILFMHKFKLPSTRHVKGPPESPPHVSDPPPMCPAQNIPSVKELLYELLHKMSATVRTVAAFSVGDAKNTQDSH